MVGPDKLKVLLLSLLCYAVALPHHVYAQQQTSSLEPMKLRIEGRIKSGTKRSILETKIWAPMRQDFTSVAYADIRFSGDNNENFEGNFGAGYRWLSDNETIYGGNIWFDRRRTERGAFFNQFTFGGEMIKQNYDFRMNMYVPISGAQAHDTPVVGNNTTPYLADTGIYYDGFGRLVEKPQYGFDIEAGYQLPFLHDHVDSFRVYAGAYDFRANNTKATTGGRVRAAMDITPNINVGTRFQYDGARGSQAFAEMTIRFPFDAKRSFRQHGLRARMDESPERDIDIVTAARQVSDGIAKPVLNTQTGDVQRVIYVDNSNPDLGDGSLDKPFQNLKTAEAALQANNVLYIFEGTGDSTHMDQGLIIAHQGVSVIGAGVGFMWQDGKFRAPDAAYTGVTLLAATNNPVITNTEAFVDINSIPGSGVAISGVGGVYVGGLRVENTTGSGFLTRAVNQHITGGVTIDRVEAENNAVRGIFLTVQNDASIDRFTVTDSYTNMTGSRGLEAIAFLDGFIGNVHFENNSINRIQGGAHSINVQAGGGGTIESSYIGGNSVLSTTVHGNGIVHAGFNGFIGTSVIENNILNSTSVAGTSSGISINPGATGTMENAIIRNNHIEAFRGRGILLHPTSNSAMNVLIEENTITGNNTINGAFYGISMRNLGTGLLTVDLGGGTLGSVGGNRIFANTNNRDMYLDIGNRVLSAQNNWWGDASGLNPVDVNVIGSSTIDSSNWLGTDPGP